VLHPFFGKRVGNQRVKRITCWTRAFCLPAVIQLLVVNM